MPKFSSRILNLLIISFALIAISCDDEQESITIGSDLLPPGDKFDVEQFVSGIDAFTYMSEPPYVVYDGVIFKERSRFLTGYIEDPFFGEIASNFAFQHKVEANFYDSIRIFASSAKLYFRVINEFSGADSLLTQGDLMDLKLSIHELNESPFFSRSNYVMKSDEYDLTPLTTEPFDTITFTNDTLGLEEGFYITLDLPETYAQSVIDKLIEVHNESWYLWCDSEKTDSCRWKQSYDYKPFYDAMPGLYAVAGSSNELGCMQFIDPSKSKMLLDYYHTDTLGNVDTSLTKVYEMDEHMIMYPIGRANSRIRYLNQEDDASQDSVIYLQSMNGYRGKLRLKDLEDFRSENQGNVIINLAEIVLPVASEQSDLTSFDVLRQVWLNGVEEDGSDLYLGAHNENSMRIHSVDTVNNEFRINVTHYIHSYLNGQVDISDLYVYIPGGNIGSQGMVDYEDRLLKRLVLTSGRHSNPPKLEITYSIIDE